MTIREVCKQLYDLSVDGTFNGEHHTRSDFERSVRRAFEDGKDAVIFHALLPAARGSSR